MDLKQLEYIIAIAEEQSIAKAAQKLFMTQSGLNQQLLKLEAELEVPLFQLVLIIQQIFGAAYLVCLCDWFLHLPPGPPIYPLSAPICMMAYLLILKQQFLYRLSMSVAVWLFVSAFTGVLRFSYRKAAARQSEFSEDVFDR